MFIFHSMKVTKFYKGLSSKTNNIGAWCKGLAIVLQRRGGKNSKF